MPAFSFSVYSVATGVKTEIENASVAVVDGDRSALSSRLREAFLQPYFRLPAMIDRSELDPAMDRGERTFVLDIPPGSRPISCADASRSFSSTSTRPP
jgi:ABC-2 type transport system permease protein